jgi:hypothetical protein
MTKPMVRIHNADTDEVIDREMTDTEFAQYEIDSAKAAEDAAKEASKAAAKEAILEKLGLTAEEADILLK